MIIAAKWPLGLLMAFALGTSANAAAITYSGTVAGKAVGLEMTDASEDAVVGQFFWFSDGVDIPLQPGASVGAGITFSEEGPCSPTLCARDVNDYDVVTRVPITATWSLSLSADGTSVTGTRTDAETGAVAPIALKRIGERHLPQNVTINPATLHDLTLGSVYGEVVPFNPATLPYNVLKLDVPLTTERTEALEGSTVAYVSDPRTRFAFPRIAELADGSDPAAANKTLALAHAYLSLRALDCKSGIYIGFGWDDREDQNWGTLGYYDKEQVRVTYLSPRVMSWNQAGALYCDGVESYEHSDSYNMDVRAGKQLDLTKVFAGVTARSYSEPDVIADPALVNLAPGDPHWHFDSEIETWLLANLAPLTNPPTNPNCVTSELIPDHIGVHFEPGDVIVFTLERQPHFTSMCLRPLVSMPVADLPAPFAVSPQVYFDN